jgi:hypothetical protein
MFNVLKAICQHYENINFLVIAYVICGVLMLIIEGVHAYGLISEQVKMVFVFMYLGATTSLLVHFWKESRVKHS